VTPVDPRAGATGQESRAFRWEKEGGVLELLAVRSAGAATDTPVSFVVGLDDAIDRVVDPAYQTPGAGYDAAANTVTLQPGFRYGFVRLVPSVATSTEPTAASSFALFPNSPNPFTDQTAIHFSLPESRNVTLEIFDALGRLIDTPLETTLPAGAHTVTWNATHAPGGSYFCRLQAGQNVHILQMTKLN
jgi:hypothetical protein